MEMLAFGFLLGMVVAIIAFLGVMVERMNEHERHHQELLCGNNRDRNVRDIHSVVSGIDDLDDSDEDEEPSAEEITSVLYVLRMGASHYERSIIDYLIDKYDERQVNNE